jgi:RNA polymerase sigma factor (TIGR02999 family)
MTDPPPTHEVTRLLVSWCDGDEAALERLMPLVHNELLRLARNYMRRERPGHTLQPTALVNEAYMRLVDWKNVRWQNRSHFFGVAAQMMRRILVDFARHRPAHKRDGGARLVTLGEADGLPQQESSADLLALDEALNALAALDPRKVAIVELKFFGGLSVEETAEVLKVSPTTVMREWARAKAWLYRELSSIEAGKNSSDRGR